MAQFTREPARIDGWHAPTRIRITLSNRVVLRQESDMRKRPLCPSRIFSVALAVFFGWLHFGHSGYAADLIGAWSTDVSACKKIFVKKGGRLSIAADSDLYGSGFIIEGNKIRGKMADCTIKSRKEDGALTHLVTTCAGDAVIGTVQFSLKIDDENRLTRIFPGVSELDRAYFRCPL